MARIKGRLLLIVARIFTVAWIVVWLTFATISGAEAGWDGLIRNLPNALPWLVPIVILLFGWNRPEIGGLLFFIFAFFALFFFNTWQDPLSFAIISAPIFISALLFLIVASSRGKKVSS